MTTASVMRRLAAAASDSWLIQVCRRLILSMQARPDALPARVVEDDLLALRTLLANGALSAATAGRVRRVVVALAGSRAVRVADGWRTRLDALPRWQLIRAAGIAALTAAAVDAALVAIDPRPASGYRWWLWAVTAVASIVVVLAARAFEAARGGSRVLSRL